MKKLVIIPAYNEEESIKNTVEDILSNSDFDYIIINDCSTDATRSICEENGFNVVNLPVNLGIGGAVQTGYRYALRYGYDIAVQVDGDGQHNPEYLDIMAMLIEEDKADMVIGSRYIDKEGFQSTFTRRLGIKWFTFLIGMLTKTKITDPTSGLRMANKTIIEEFVKNYPNDYPEPESTVAVLCKKYRVLEQPVKMRARQGGKSSINPSKSIYYMIKVSLAILVETLRGGK